MIRKTRNAKTALEGFFCLPTSSRFHMAEPKRSGAYQEGQDAFLLQATQSVEEGGYPQYVILTAPEGTLDWEIGTEPQTQHAEVRKNLPPRRVVGILRADGTTEGDIPAKGLGYPHWSLIPANKDGSASLEEINAVGELLKSNRAKAVADKQALRDAKNGNAGKPGPASSSTPPSSNVPSTSPRK